jgi:hypothetical protein
MYASIAGYRLGMEEGTPEQYQRYGEHATLVETRLGPHRSRRLLPLGGASAGLAVSVCRAALGFGSLGGKSSGVLLVPETHILVVGAGERALA